MRDGLWEVWVYILYTSTTTTGAADLKSESQTQKAARGPLSPARRARARAVLGAARARAWPGPSPRPEPCALDREDTRHARTGLGLGLVSDPERTTGPRDRKAPSRGLFAHAGMGGW
jgi:hypothetical protein